jgi:hypothetical protein
MSPCFADWPRTASSASVVPRATKDTPTSWRARLLRYSQKLIICRSAPACPSPGGASQRSTPLAFVGFRLCGCGCLLPLPFIVVAAALLLSPASAPHVWPPPQPWERLECDGRFSQQASCQPSSTLTQRQPPASLTLFYPLPNNFEAQDATGQTRWASLPRPKPASCRQRRNKTRHTPTVGDCQ